MADCAHTHTTLGQTVKANGDPLVWLRCNLCGANAAGHGQWRRHVPYTGRKQDLPVFEDHTHDRPPCVVCGAWGTEEHHWAPKAMFGQGEADRWPKSWLCRRCHNLWHVTIIRETLHHPEWDQGRVPV